MPSTPFHIGLGIAWSAVVLVLALAGRAQAQPSSTPGAQALPSGQYFGSKGGMVTTLSLYDDGSFFMSVSDGEAGVAGRGEWRAERDSLHLFFTRPFHFDFPRWEIVDSTPADETRISVIALSGPNGIPIPGSVVGPVPHSGYGTIVDVKGRAELEIPNDVAYEYLEARFVGRMPVRIPRSELQGRRSTVKVYLFWMTHEVDILWTHIPPPDPEKRYETAFGLEHQLHGRIALQHDAFSVVLEKRQ